MGDTKIGKDSIGRIAERIVANELEFHGFVVRDLNLGSLAADVDLLAAKNGKIWQVQVKGTRYDTNFGNNGWWFQYGYCKAEHISNEHEPMFNRVGNSFKADVVALVCVKSPQEYRCVVLPIEKAEEAAQINLNYAYRTLKKDGSVKKPGVVWMAFHVPKTTDEKRKDMQREIDLIKGFEENNDKWNIDCTVAPSNLADNTTA